MNIGLKMPKTYLFPFAFLVAILLLAAPSYGQIFDPDTVSVAGEYENIQVKKMYSDSNASVFVIWVKGHVAKHFHANHTECVTIVEGEGNFLLGDEWTKVFPGDQIVIPAGTPHEVKVTSAKPMKVISIQTPEFLGADRIFMED